MGRACSATGAARRSWVGGALDALGGSDPCIFIWANELEFTMRLLDRGFRYLHLPGVEAVHIKPLERGFNERKHRMNTRRYAYVAAKLMRPTDACTTVVNLAVGMVIDWPVVRRRAITGVPELVRGVVTGLRRRQPIRPAVSVAYRENFRVFAPPWRYIRSPVERWTVRLGTGSATARRASRQQSFFEARPRFFPIQCASLQL
jgi:GT2 family glycosyltransferase